MEKFNNFISNIMTCDLENGKVKSIQTRHPPEPSGYLHIGHVRNIVLNYGLAENFGGICNLRYDDTNPAKEKKEYIDGIQEDVLWLGFKWNKIFYATDYFEQNYEYAKKLIQDGKAFVCDLSPEELSASRGTLTQGGTNSPYRNRSVEENLELFEKMKNGDFEAGKCCLRAKIDMNSPSLFMRDPVIYRIQYLDHHRIGRKWNIYPTYDFSHPLDDSLEGVTHSICGVEFEEHRPLYDWVLENCEVENKCKQIEYSSLLIKNAISGKRNIKKLVEEKIVSGWDDPRLYTLRGLRRRGVLPESLIDFVIACGLSRNVTICEQSMLDHFVRNTLNNLSKRVMAVLDPVKLVLNNFEGEEEIEFDNYPQNKNSSKRIYPFGRELLIERSDFEIDPPKKYHRLYVGNRVRLKGAYVVECTGYELDENGNVSKVFADVLKNTKSGTAGADEIKVKGTIHWLNEKYAQKCEVRSFENLLDEGEEGSTTERAIINDFKINLNSFHTNCNAFVEKNIEFEDKERYQFIRNAYYCLDKDSTKENLVFNRIVSLKEAKFK